MREREETEKDRSMDGPAQSCEIFHVTSRNIDLHRRPFDCNIRPSHFLKSRIGVVHDWQLEVLIAK